ncbi:Flp family type IVb pilin [Trichloromonas sp.]|uniref:Flp family type IVb pilin n=1 Tax=Trichloromonas sp. TaxID=3069249 RepID=UPI003D815BAC
MKSIRDLFQGLLKDDEGATAVEYAIMAGLIAAVIAGTVAAFGSNLNTLFSNCVEKFPK